MKNELELTIGGVGNESVKNVVQKRKLHPHELAILKHKGYCTRGLATYFISYEFIYQNSLPFVSK